MRPGAGRPGEPDRQGERRCHCAANGLARHHDQDGAGDVKLSPERVTALAGQLVAKLVAAGMIEPVADRRVLTASLERAIVEELNVEDRINAEAKALMRQYESEIARGQMNEQQLFQMIKKQLVKEKGVVL
ncbi:MAG: DUF507 family protein [Nitrospirae bacterium]|nr:MAG: DUF507 family protein [Nitrospirota bacterium]